MQFYGMRFRAGAGQICKTITPLRKEEALNQEDEKTERLFFQLLLYYIFRFLSTMLKYFDRFFFGFVFNYLAVLDSILDAVLEFVRVGTLELLVRECD